MDLNTFRQLANQRFGAAPEDVQGAPANAQTPAANSETPAANGQTPQQIQSQRYGSAINYAFAVDHWGLQ